MPNVEVSVIIPTLALRERRDLLRRAIASVMSQREVTPVPIVVLNGRLSDPDTVAELRRDARLRIVCQEHTSLPDALRLGRSKVTTPWFSTLDDDDELLPEALAARVQALAADGRFDTIVTNGYVRTDSADSLVVPDMDSIARDPLRMFLKSNWLLPGSWLCAADSDSAALFDGMPAHLECTYLAVQFATRRRVRFLNAPTVVWYANTPSSASKSKQYRLGQEFAIRRLLKLELPADVRRAFRRRLGAACHDAARLEMQSGDRRMALVRYLRSVVQPGGWRYLPFCWRLLVGRREAKADAL
jgi:glycosyltransferase involved in cell wall biosynthesis